MTFAGINKAKAYIFDASFGSISSYAIDLSFLNIINSWSADFKLQSDANDKRIII